MIAADRARLNPALVARFRGDVERVLALASAASVRTEPVEGHLPAPGASPGPQSGTAFVTRHPGLVPGSTAPHDLRPEGARHGGPRDEPGVTAERAARYSPLALAVSGGPDSMALLTLAAAAYPGHVVAATVDHGLRPEAAGEARMVAAHCAAIGVPHATLRIPAPPAPHDNVHAWARAHRYALLACWAIDAGAACLATAHHADDQAETFLMRAARGAGVAGLAGVRAVQPTSPVAPVALIRPLLDWRVGELRALVEALDVPFIDDPSNADPRYDRTRVRALLRAASWLDPMQLARCADNVAEADGALREIEAWLWETRRLPPNRHPGPVPGSTEPHDHRPVDARHGGPRDEPGVTEGKVSLDIADLPRELRRRLARRAIHAVRQAAGIARPAFTDSTNIESLLDALGAGKSATQGGVIASARGTVWRFAPEPPRRHA